jgi:hypothetical protein
MGFGDVEEPTLDICVGHERIVHPLGKIGFRLRLFFLSLVGHRWETVKRLRPVTFLALVKPSSGWASHSLSLGMGPAPGILGRPSKYVAEPDFMNDEVNSRFSPENSF